jgi:hypothetical protein
MENRRAGNAIPLMLFSKRGRSNTQGCAQMRSACGIKNGKNYGITESNGSTSRRSVQNTARIFAHELGHMVSTLHFSLDIAVVNTFISISKLWK